jgi:hypothetical protein
MRKKLLLVVILSAFAEGSLFSISESMAQGPTPVAPTPAEPPTPSSPCANACKELIDHFKLTLAGKYNVLCGDFKCTNLYNSCEDYCIPNPFLR